MLARFEKQHRSSSDQTPRTMNNAEQLDRLEWIADHCHWRPLKAIDPGRVAATRPNGMSPDSECDTPAFWHPAASIVTTHPAIEVPSSSSILGIAVISFDFSSVTRSASVNPRSLAHALTWEGRRPLTLRLTIAFLQFAAAELFKLVQDCSVSFDDWLKLNNSEQT